MEVKQKKTVNGAMITVAAVCGVITPFVDFLVAIEFFYLAIPILLLLVGSLAYLMLQIIFRKRNTAHGLFLACIVPTFIGCQLVATYSVDKIQRFRAERIISRIEMNHQDPSDNETLGIRVVHDVKSNSFKVSYSRGFMIREVYNGNLKRWESSGWND